MKIRALLVAITVLFSINAFGQSPQKVHANVVITPFQYNTSDDDFAPSISQDGRLLFVTSESDNSQRIQWTEKSGDSWKSLSDAGSEVNAGVQVGSASLTSDGQVMIFAAYRHDLTGFGRTDLYSARKVNGKWTDVRNLGSQVNSDAWDSQPSISPDGSVLYFASDRSGSVGGTDIYVSYRKGNVWTKAEPVTGLNSKADEASPCIAADNSTLYFASNRDGGAGGYDIYVARLQGGIFGSVQNLGSPVNTSSDEYYYTSVPNTTTAYFASNRSGGRGGFDIYRADPNPEMPDAVLTLTGVVSDITNGKPLGADIIITDLNTRQKIAVLRSDDQTGEYFATLTGGRSYSITATRPDYVFYSERIDVPNADKGKTVRKDIKLTPVANDAEVRLLIFFDTDKSDLKDESLPELDRAVDFLNTYKDVRVRIEGHTDDVGDDNYNLQLSQRRADAVKTYLVNQQVDSKRIRTAGLGESMPKVKGTSDEARAQNRRVEMKIQK